jgi:membrane glycosyltransferase
MLSHSWFVLNILIGRNTRWGTQLRGGDGIGLGVAVAAFAPHTLIGLGTGVLAWTWTPADFWWYLPLLAGLASAILFGWLTSLPALGAAARRCGLFLVPSETASVPIVDRVEALLAGRGAREHAVEDGSPEGEALQTA